MHLLLAALFVTTAQQATISAEFEQGREYAMVPNTILRTHTEYIQPAQPPTSGTDSAWLNYWIQAGVCSGDTVIVGRVTRARSYLTANRKNIYTLAQVEVLDRIKASTSLTSIEVVRPGGIVKTSQGTFTAADSSFELLKEESSYLFFLTQRNGAYYASPWDFAIDGQSVRQARDAAESTFSLAEALRAARETVCVQ